MRVCIIVLNYNAGKYIDSCLESLRNIKYSNCEILVVDNASTDDSLRGIIKRYPNFKILTSKRNTGYAGGNNLGLRYAIENDFDAAWIINPDIRVDKYALEPLVKLAKINERIAAVGSKVYFEKGYEFHPERYQAKDLGKVLWFAGGIMDWKNVFSRHIGMDEIDDGKYDLARQTEFLTGSSLFIKTSVLKEVGLMDEKYFLYYEESDLCQKIIKAGYTLWYCPDSVVWHANAQSTGVGSAMVDYYTTRNRMLFGMRWAPFKAKIALFREGLRLLVGGRPWQRKGVRDYFMNNFGKGSYEN